MNNRPSVSTQSPGVFLMMTKQCFYEPVQVDDPLSVYLSRISSQRPLNPAAEAEIARRIREGDREAWEELIRRNLKFVVSVSRNYQNQGLPLSDLINEGNLGLIRAAERFDEKKNFKFISYAVWWIRQSILQALAEQSRIVSLPLNRIGTLYKIGKVQGKLEQRYQRLPKPEEIAQELGIDTDDVDESIKIGNNHVSLDAPVRNSEDEDTRLIDTIPDTDQARPDESASNLFIHNRIEHVLSRLGGKEKYVLKLYFGIGEETPHTLEEIGVRLDLTRERVRQIKEKAIKKLRRMSHVARMRTTAF